MYYTIAEDFHEKFIGKKYSAETLGIAYDYVQFIIERYKELLEKEE